MLSKVLTGIAFLFGIYWLCATGFFFYKISEISGQAALIVMVVGFIGSVGLAILATLREILAALVKE